jgi:hypothetical protein
MFFKGLGAFLSIGGRNVGAAGLKQPVMLFSGG